MAAAVRSVPPRAPPAGVENPSASTAALLALLKTEEAARKATSQVELLTLAVNDLMRLANARQAFALKPSLRGYKVAAVSSLASFDPNAPLVQSIERLAGRAGKSNTLETPHVLSSGPAQTDSDPSLTSYPFRHLLWLPMLSRRGRLIGGLVLARETSWSDGERVVPERLAETYAHALRAFVAETKWWPAGFSLSRATGLAAVLAGLVLLIPVHMTTLAPFEVGSSQSFLVAAPIDGVIEEIVVEANAPVKTGDVLVRLNDIALRNRLEIAGHEAAVANARMLQTTQLAFGDPRGRHELGIARAEYALKIAERDYAQELLEKTRIRATRDGLAVYADKHNLIGKPVATGERIMELADPKFVELRIDVPVGDAISVRSPSPLKAFFDADPLNARSGTVRHADYQARLQAGDVLAFRVLADLSEAAEGFPRLGSRGTAQLTGDQVPLAFYLFRRPLTALRQRFGS